MNQVSTTTAETDPLPEPSFFDLDMDQLVEEWTTHSRTYYRYALKQADARAVHERAKVQRDLVEAQLDKTIRYDPERFGIEKVTEGVVGKTIIRQRDYRIATAKMLEARHDAETAQAVVDALEHRKRAMESLTQLYVAGFRAEPRLPRGEAREAIDEVERKAVFSKGKK